MPSRESVVESLQNAVSASSAAQKTHVSSNFAAQGAARELGKGSRDLKPKLLPYQANHQIELLHLQAEAEALLQELKTLQQQRLAATH